MTAVAVVAVALPTGSGNTRKIQNCPVFVSFSFVFISGCCCCCCRRRRWNVYSFATSHTQTDKHPMHWLLDIAGRSFRILHHKFLADNLLHRKTALVHDRRPACIPLYCVREFGMKRCPRVRGGGDTEQHSFIIKVHIVVHPIGFR